jgi:isopenicillin-N epimerase
MPSSSPFASHWTLDQGVDFLNHGCYGACPREVLATQADLRAEMERQPIAFLSRKLPALFDAARAALGAFVGADPEGLVAVPNATSGVSTVVRSIAPELAPGDELLTTDHAYNACRNALDFVSAQSGARLVVTRIPFPLADPAEVVAALLANVSARTRIALVDHVTSPTGLVLPVEAIIAALAARGIDTLVDGAHAPGQLALDIGRLGAAWYTGNCHKWVCAPKGAAFLWAREDRRDALRPLVVSHGYNTSRPGRSRLHDEFDWQGTGDPTPFLSVPRAIEVMGGMVPGGWSEVRERNHALVLLARTIVAEALGVEPPCPPSMVGSLASLPLPYAASEPAAPAMASDALQQELLDRFAIEVPIFPWPAPVDRLVRLSAQLHNEPAQYRRLGAALRELLQPAAAAASA